MKKAELQVYVRNTTGLEMDSLNSMSEMEQLKIKEGIVAKLWHGFRGAVIFFKPFIKIKRGWSIAIEAFIAAMDTFYGTGK